MMPVRNEMILASAGSGKTFALTDRYVQLLALGAKPEQIVALTFTRKAAGEFFDGILNKLARAAGDAEAASELGERIGAMDTEPETFLRILRGVVDAMPRLSLSTFDAFFARVVRAFPLELGLAGDFEILQAHGALIERRRVLARIFRHDGAGPDEHQRNFIEAFKRATFGAEEKSLAARLDRYLDEHHEAYLAAPDARLWGNPDSIWPDGCAWLDEDPGMPTGALRAWADSASINAKQRGRWHDFLHTAETWSPGAPLPRPLEYVIEKALANWDALGRGDAVLEFDRKKQELSAAACAALRAIVKHIVRGEFLRRLETTRGIHAILDGYERVYHDAVRRAGRLTFADVQRLLQQDDILGLGGEAARATPEGLARAERRMLIDWRLDGQFEHWLLDEFQDTSAGQWSVLKNLIDEVIQDDSGRRSLFYVGDVKQAIYAWREGDARLFREIFNYYNAAAPGAIAERWLDRSFRSGPAILAMVNTVFGDRDALDSLFPREAARRWSDEWREHASAVPDRRGHSAWIFAEDKAARFDATLKILQEIDPIGRGLTAAVLAQTNDMAAELADHLRRAGGLRAVAESDLHVCVDNPMTAALLALFKAAAHPGDSLAREHARMTPLAREIAALGGHERDAVTRALLRSIHNDGFEATVEEWLRRLEPTLEADDAFSRERGRQMAEAARLFDETGSRDVAEFIQFMERHVVRESETSAVVRVMTIHKAKGLGFDVVVLPDLEGDKLGSRRKGLAARKSADRVTEWVLDLPPKPFQDCDPVLARFVESAEADACYDKLALLYVALTRAKRGLYVITKDPEKSSSNNFPKLLSLTLGEGRDSIPIGSRAFGGPWSEGDPAWHESIVMRPIAEAVSPFESIDAGVLAHRATRLDARTPSDHRSGTVRGASLFAGGSDAAAFGTEVHALLALVEWWTPESREPWRAATRVAGFSDNAIALAAACLDAPGLSEVFTPPPGAGSSEVWRERAFEMVDGSAWITGKFDRVIVERAADGVVERVRVYDFKTDRVGRDPSEWRSVADGHARQMTIYGRAAARLAGAPPDRVTTSVILVNAAHADGRRAPAVFEVRPA